MHNIFAQTIMEVCVVPMKSAQIYLSQRLLHDDYCDRLIRDTQMCCFWRRQWIIRNLFEFGGKWVFFRVNSLLNCSSSIK